MTRHGGIRRRDGERGFTLIELLVVITIISILAAVVSTSVGGFITQANEATRRAQFAAVQTAVDTFVSAHLDASGSLDQATYPIAPSRTSTDLNSPTGAWVVSAAGSVTTGKTAPFQWYGRDGRVCGQSDAVCTAQPSSASATTGLYIFVDLYSGTATDISSMLSASGGVKTFSKPSVGSGGGFRCLFVTGSAGSQTADTGAGLTVSGIQNSEISAAVSNVRANIGKVYGCRDADPKTAGA